VPDPQLRQLADDYWEAHIAEKPMYASMIGDRRFDDRLEDVSDEADARRRASYHALQIRLAGLDGDGFDITDRVTQRMLAEELRSHISLIDARYLDMAWDSLDGVVGDLLVMAPQVSATTPESARALVERYRQVPRLLGQAIDRHRHALVSGRTPPRLVVERTRNMVDKYLASPVEDDTFVTFPGPQGWDGEPAWREELALVTRESIRPGMADYRRFLDDELLPVARADDRCGLTWLGAGDEYYRTLVRQHVGLDMDPREIHEIGMAELTEKLPDEYAAAGGRQFGLTDVPALFERLLTDPDLRYTARDELIDHARIVLEAGAAVMHEWFGRLPKADCDIQPVSEHLEADWGAYYLPPATDGSRPGTYFVNTSDPEHKNRYETAAVTCHEAIPGHHLQIAIAAELEGLPDFQRFSNGHTAYCEGWGLYSERLAEEMGLYRDDLDRLGMLGLDSMRSCRLVVDTGIHALGWSRERAVEFMAAHTPISRGEVELEIDRYIAIPGQALAYKIGQLEIFAARRRAETALGGAFDIRRFHDTVLGSAVVSLPVMNMLVDELVAS
jgi:uncharacterized protein (DUF885 family)